MRVIVGIVDYKAVGLNEALLYYGCLSFRPLAKNYDTLRNLLKYSGYTYFGVRDFKLENQELRVFQEELKNYLTPFVQEKEEKQIGLPDTRIVLGKNIHIYLRDPIDKVISVFAKLYLITEECINENKPMYFSVVEENV